MEKEDLVCYFDGKFMKESEVRIPLRDKALWNGYGAHEVSRTYNHIPRFWEEHIERLILQGISAKFAWFQRLFV